MRLWPITWFLFNVLASMVAIIMCLFLGVVIVAIIVGFLNSIFKRK